MLEKTYYSKITKDLYFDKRVFVLSSLQICCTGKQDLIIITLLLFAKKIFLWVSNQITLHIQELW